MVSRDSLPELIAAGKELRIKGLQDMVSFFYIKYIFFSILKYSTVLHIMQIHFCSLLTFIKRDLNNPPSDAVQ